MDTNSSFGVPRTQFLTWSQALLAALKALLAFLICTVSGLSWPPVPALVKFDVHQLAQIIQAMSHCLQSSAGSSKIRWHLVVSGAAQL